MDWVLFFTMIGTGVAVIAIIYQIMRNFKEDVNKNFEKYERRFEKHERRFELLENRIFLLAMGKDLPSILKAEREENKNEGSKT